MQISKKGHRPDYFLIALIFILTVFGLVILTSASSDIGKSKFDDSYYYLKHQLLNGLVVGIIGFFIVSKFVFYGFYKKIALPLLFFNMILLLLVFSPLGVKAGGASRWLSLGPITFQPAEFLKLTFILYVAAWLSNPKTNRSRSFYSGFLPFLIVCGITAGLLILQPATSTVAILLSAGLIVYFLSGAPVKYIAATCLIGLICLTALILITPYRKDRIMTFFKPSEVNVLDEGYHRNQALIAIGSGGFLGSGYGQSLSKTSRLPAVVDDSIFAVAAQELGFVGAGSLIILFGLLVLHLFWLAKKSRDNFGRYTLIGFGSIIAFQSIVNMGAISGLLPLTGIPLPFISYGGTALAVFLVMSGIAVNISKYN